MKDYVNYDQFVEEFDIVQNALEMRYLTRWNGRRVGKETLSEHTHLVVACAMHLMDKIFADRTPLEPVDKYKVVKACMLHDSLEILRGDILSITKEAHSEIGLAISAEEKEFEFSQNILLNKVEDMIVSTADTMSVVIFLKNEMEEGNTSSLIRSIYTEVRKKLTGKFDELAHQYNCVVQVNDVPGPYFVKGYAEDAGTDVTLKEDVTFLPMSTQTVRLHVCVTPHEGELAYLCARTSAAAKGLCVAMCPIDPNYCGEVLAIVHNVSNDIIEYKAGEAFCQVVSMPFTNLVIPDKIKKPGTRTNSNRGGTDT